MSEVTALKEEIRVKIEKIACLKKAVSIANREHDKIHLQELQPDSEDVDEIDDILYYESDDDMAAVETNKQPNADDSDSDVIEIDPNESRPSITVGVPCVEIDRDFSLEYTFVRDVSSI